jgi:hypothetical protein
LSQPVEKFWKEKNQGKKIYEKKYPWNELKIP